MREHHDPIERSRARILAAGWASEDELKDIDKRARAAVADAADFATNDPEPDPSELWTDVLK
ncbi:Dehydrogenase E1 component [compost metagenome]